MHTYTTAVMRVSMRSRVSMGYWALYQAATLMTPQPVGHLPNEVSRVSREAPEPQSAQ